MMKQQGVQHWVQTWTSSNPRNSWLESQPSTSKAWSGGYTGPGGKTILPHKAVAKIDMRLVPNLTAEGALAALKAHLAKHGFGDIEVNMSGGYNPTSTAADSALIRAEQAVYKRSGYDPILWPRLGGSWPGYVFTDDPVKLPAGHFGLGLGTAPTHRTNTTSSSQPTQRSRGSMERFVLTSIFCTNSRQYL